MLSYWLLIAWGLPMQLHVVLLLHGFSVEGGWCLYAFVQTLYGVAGGVDGSVFNIADFRWKTHYRRRTHGFRPSTHKRLESVTPWRQIRRQRALYLSNKYNADQNKNDRTDCFRYVAEFYISFLYIIFITLWRHVYFR